MKLKKLKVRPLDKLPFLKKEPVLRTSFLDLSSYKIISSKRNNNMFSKLLGFLKGRGTELTTYMGAALVGLLGLSPEVAQGIMNVVIPVVGLILMFKPDKGQAAVVPTSSGN